MSAFSLSLTGHFAPADKARSDYAYIPFALPQAASRLHIRYTYSAPMSSDKVSGGNVIDIGLFDPRGKGFPGGEGFRGWSGSARNEFMIGLNAATPGYLPGPLPAGEYQIILGLYRIWEQGAEYEIHIEADLDSGPIIPEKNGNIRFKSIHASAPKMEPESGSQPVDDGIWLKGDLQSHTFHSDAKGSPQQLVAKARTLGLNFLAITDHNTVSHHPLLAELAGDDLLLIPGQEVTTYGHMNVWGTGCWCDFRCQSAVDMRAIIDFAHKNGGVCSINHPKQGGPAWEYGYDLPVETMEIWQGPWVYRNAESLALWDQLLAQGRRIPAVGGSDYHCPAEEEINLLRLGQPTTWTQVREICVAGILEALCAGRTCISATPDGPRLALSARSQMGFATMGQVLLTAAGEALELTVVVDGGAGHELRLIVDGSVAEIVPITEQKHIFSQKIQASMYVRAELVSDMQPENLPENVPAGLDLNAWRWAVSNPVFIER